MTLGREEYDLMAIVGFLCGHWRTSLDWRKKAAEDQRGGRKVYLYRSSSLGGGGLARGSGMYSITIRY